MGRDQVGGMGAPALGPGKDQVANCELHTSGSSGLSKVLCETPRSPFHYNVLLVYWCEPGKFRTSVHTAICPGLLSSCTVTGPLKNGFEAAILASEQMRGQVCPTEKPQPWTNTGVLEFPLHFSSASLSPTPSESAKFLAGRRMFL